MIEQGPSATESKIAVITPELLQTLSRIALHETDLSLEAGIAAYLTAKTLTDPVPACD